ncbi:hypothetical protein DV737_g1521, partial [Chaetothyriales sp. CBS 132003]
MEVKYAPSPQVHGVATELNYVEHCELLDSVKWQDHTANGFQYIEGRQYEKLRHCRADVNFWTDWLAGEALEDWLSENVRFSKPGFEPEWGTLQGGFRLLICDRSLACPPHVMCSQSQMLMISQSFDLAPETVPSLGQILGAYGVHYQIASNGANSIQIVIQSFQKGELGNWTLSLRHNLETSWTHALAMWTGWTSVELLAVDGKWPSRFQHMCALVQAVPSLWTHPTCLPLVFMQQYSVRTRTRCNLINQELVVLDAELGVNQAGRHIRVTSLADDWPSSLNFKKLTIGLHSVSNQLVFVQQAAKWARRCLEFLLRLEDDLAGQNLIKGNASPSIKESLAYQISVITGVEDSFDALKSRAQGATSVLFNASSQNDSLLNVKIAASTKEDSIVMKTFTFLTALFLPGTFVAALLSVTLINWFPSNGSPSGQSQSQNSGISVSNYYWVYWLLTVPMTLLVMLGWYLWYRHANQKWLKEAGLPNIARSSPSG